MNDAFRSTQIPMRWVRHRLRLNRSLFDALADGTREGRRFREGLFRQPGLYSVYAPPKFQRHLEQLSRLPRARQRFVLDMLETVLQQAGR